MAARRLVVPPRPATRDASPGSSGPRRSMPSVSRWRLRYTAVAIVEILPYPAHLDRVALGHEVADVADEEGEADGAGEGEGRRG